MVFEKVVNLIVGQLPVKAEDVKMESRLFEDLGADSANVMMLIMDLEAEFDLTGVDTDDVEIRMIDDTYSYTPTGKQIRDGKLILPANSCIEIQF